MTTLLDSDVTPVVRAASVDWLARKESRQFAESFRDVERWRAVDIVRWVQQFGVERFEHIALQIDWRDVARRINSSTLTPEYFELAVA